MATVSTTHIVWLFSSTLLIVAGASAFLLGSQYGTGLAILSALVLGGGFWIFATHKVDRMVEDLHTRVVVHHPRVLTMVPLKVAKLAARQQRSHQSEVNNYLTGLAQWVRPNEGKCLCCGVKQPMLSRYPYDSHLHARGCEVAAGWAEFGNPELCPWGILFSLPQSVLVSQLDPNSAKGLYHFAVKQAETWGYGGPEYFRAVGLEFLRHQAASTSDDMLERLGRKVIQEFELESSAADRELQLIE